MNEDRQPHHAADLHGALPSGSSQRGRRRRGWVGWLAGMVAIGVVFGFVIIALLKVVDGPAQADSQSWQAAKASVMPTSAPPKTNDLAGLYVELSYPGSFDAVTSVKTDAQALEQYNIGSKSNYKHVITVDVRSLPSGALADDASYKLRHNDTADYHESASHIGAEPTVLMTKTDKQEQTLFWVHQGKLLTVAVTSSDPKDDINAIMTTITTGSRWRQ